MFIYYIIVYEAEAYHILEIVPCCIDLSELFSNILSFLWMLLSNLLSSFLKICNLSNKAEEMWILTLYKIYNIRVIHSPKSFTYVSEKTSFVLSKIIWRLKLLCRKYVAKHETNTPGRHPTCTVTTLHPHYQSLQNWETELI